MEKIRSSDGTSIAYQRSGHGSPLIAVHGTTADHTRWMPILPVLERSFTVYTLDRRGRGESGDTRPYTIKQEFEDILALIDSIPETVFLLGHSYGAICSLEAARRTTRIRKLVLYEPPIRLGPEHYSPEVLSKLQTLLDGGEQEEALITFQQEIVRVPPHELALLRSSPSWPARIATTHTMVRELRGANAYVFEATRFRDLKTPTLLLLGGDSPAYFKAAIEAVHDALPESQVRIMAGQQHAAINTAPELFTREVVEFLAQVD
ncbi:MAG: alpha/beta hydrolase [Ktedonobacteraceae bacterium]|nr:alpha/beta hydrolase [Chloroflexota bacterium]